MKKTFAATLLSLLLLVSPMHVALADDCSCTASDGSCSASVSCPGGCLAACGSGGRCSARCARTEEPPPEEITLQVANSDSRQLSSELTRVSGREIVFTASASDAIFNFDFKNAPVWDVLEILSESGTVQVDGEDFQKLQGLRRALLTGERINVCFRNVSVNNIMHWLSFISGLPLRVSSGNAQGRATIILREATLRDIIRAVSTRTGTQVTVARR